MSSDDSGDVDFPSIESYTPGYRLNAMEALRIVFGENPADALDDVAEVEYYAQNPDVLATTLAKDFAKLITVDIFGRKDDDESISNNLLWSFSPLMQSERYYRLLSTLIPSSPVNYRAFLELGVAVRDRNEEALIKAIDFAREEIALFSLWLAMRDETSKQQEQIENRRKSASLEDARRAIDEIRSEGKHPTKELLGQHLRQKGFSVGGSRLNRMKRQIERLEDPQAE